MSAVSLLQNPELLFHRKCKVTIEPTNSLTIATGIPPHVMQLNMMTSLLELCQTTLLRVNEHATVVRETIFEAMELRAIENGQITCHRIVDILDEFRKGIKEDVTTQFTLIQAVPGVNAQVQAMSNVNNQQQTLYTYSGRFWDVPKNFVFPTNVKRDVGWRRWLQGMPAYRTVDENGQTTESRIKSFKHFLPA